MAQENFTGDDLKGLGTILSDKGIGSFSTNTAANVNFVSIINNGPLNYVTIEQVDKTADPLFVTDLSIYSIGLDVAQGAPASGPIINASTINEGDYIGWKLGKHEFRFQSELPLTSQDTIQYLSPDKESRLYTFYWEWNANNTTKATNLIDKINEVDVDRMQEFNALFRDFGLVTLQTDTRTGLLNGVPVNRNGVNIPSQIFSIGKNPYPIVGGGDGLNYGLRMPYTPFITTPYSVDLVIPPTTDLRQTTTNNSITVKFIATSGTVNSNQFRIRAAGNPNNITVTINDSVAV